MTLVIQVEYQDIAASTPGDLLCPIARAANRALGRDDLVFDFPRRCRNPRNTMWYLCPSSQHGKAPVALAKLGAEAPREACEFAADFDDSKLVSPLRFQLSVPASWRSPNHGHPA